MIDDEAEGIVHWALVEFAEMKEYKPDIEHLQSQSR